MEYTASNLPSDILIPTLRGVFDSIMFDMKMESFFGAFLIALGIILVILFFYKQMEKAPIKSFLSKLYDFFGPLKFLIIGLVIFCTYYNTSNSFKEISDYNSRVEMALSVEANALDESIKLIRERQFELCSYSDKPTVINDSFYLDKYYSNSTSEYTFTTYLKVHLVNKENISALFNIYIKSGDANLDIYKESISRREYKQYKEYIDF